MFTRSSSHVFRSARTPIMTRRLLCCWGGSCALCHPHPALHVPRTLPDLLAGKELRAPLVHALPTALAIRVRDRGLGAAVLRAAACCHFMALLADGSRRGCQRTHVHSPPHLHLLPDPSSVAPHLLPPQGRLYFKGFRVTWPCRLPHTFSGGRGRTGGERHAPHLSAAAGFRWSRLRAHGRGRHTRGKRLPGHRRG